MIQQERHINEAFFGVFRRRIGKLLDFVKFLEEKFELRGCEALGVEG